MKRLLSASAAVALALPSLAQAQRPVDTLRLSLSDAISVAMRESDEIRLTLANADVADAQFGVARATALPQLRINTSYNHQWENSRSAAIGQVFNQPNTYQANLVFSQTFFQGGRIFAGIRGANATRAATHFDEQEVRARLTVDVQRAYLQVLFTNRMVGIQETNLALASARADQVAQLEKAGRAARYDVLRSGVERENIEPLVIQAKNDRELAVIDFKRLLNIPVTQPISLTTTIDAEATKAILVASIDTNVTPDRASIRSAELSVLSRREGVKIARADMLPTAGISITNGYSAFPPIGTGFPTARGISANRFCAASASATASCQNGGWFHDLNMTATLSFPVFDGLRAKSSIDLARAQQELAETNLRLQREIVGLEVARARAELNRARSVSEARQQNVANADEAFRLANLRFTRGLSTQLEVSDAQLALLTAQSTEARATFDLVLAAAELARALGRPIPIPAATSASRSSDNGTPRDQ
jgi:outer membrane protein TolC